jgi:ankyrin repeat protein
MKIKYLLVICALLLSQQTLAACSKYDWQQLVKHADTPTVNIYVKNQHCDIDQSLDDVSKTPLVYAIEARNRAAVQALLQAGANPNIDGYDGNTPLFYAIATKDMDIVQFLIAKGADVNASTRMSEITVLMAAVLNSSPGIVAYLVAHGASVDDTDKYNHQAMDYVEKLPPSRRAEMRAALNRH